MAVHPEHLLGLPGCVLGFSPWIFSVKNNINPESPFSPSLDNIWWSSFSWPFFGSDVTMKVACRHVLCTMSLIHTSHLKRFMSTFCVPSKPFLFQGDFLYSSVCWGRCSRAAGKVRNHQRTSSIPIDLRVRCCWFSAVHPIPALTSFWWGKCVTLCVQNLQVILDQLYQQTKVGRHVLKYK